MTKSLKSSAWIFIFIIILVLNTKLNAQGEMVDVVYLNNGSVFRGIVIELVPDSIVKIQTLDGKLLVFHMSEVKKITKEQYSFNLMKSETSSMERTQTKTLKSDPFKFGVKGGVNFASWDVSGESEIEEFTGITCTGVGLFIEQYNPPISFRLEAMLISKGAKESIDALDTEITYKINTISLIPFIVLYIDESYKTRLFFELGIEIAWIISKKGEYEIAGYNDEEYLENFSNSETALNFGIGILIDNNVHIDVRYSLGVTDLITVDEVKAKSRGIQIMVGFSN